MAAHHAPPDATTTSPNINTDSSSATEQPWYAGYPPAKSEPLAISRHQVLRLLQTDAGPERHHILVDLRRTDFEGGTIVGSINLPAQSLYPTIPALYSLFSAAGVEKVIWYCGSSRGRGTRAAAWFAEYIQEKGDARMESFVLVEGIKGWVGEGGDFVRFMQEFDESKWR
ncbi:hypothetical protein LTR62_003331 [Meristemomyces frigidus]|uniref:Rhodanese domain-containing protein n=1 Tax=Meristemomyces frigidus TaxID=1508187 RepID=A0AAN7YRW5_9PEZI|nr:hypothetical protein LTR62_003331 [Meristemomyces frigidus]